MSRNNSNEAMDERKDKEEKKGLTEKKKEPPIIQKVPKIQKIQDNLGWLTNAGLVGVGVAPLIHGTEGVFTFNTVATALPGSMVVALGETAIHGLIETYKAYQDKEEEERQRKIRIAEGLNRFLMGSFAILLKLKVIAPLAACSFAFPAVLACLTIGMIAKEQSALSAINEKIFRLKKAIKQGERDHETLMLGSGTKALDRRRKGKPELSLAAQSQFIVTPPLSRDDTDPPLENNDEKIRNLKKSIREKKAALGILEAQQRAVTRSRNTLLIGGVFCVTVLVVAALFPPTSIVALSLAAVAVVSFLIMNRRVAAEKAKAAKEVARLQGIPTSDKSSGCLSLFCSKTPQDSETWSVANEDSPDGDDIIFSRSTSGLG